MLQKATLIATQPLAAVRWWQQPTPMLKPKTQPVFASNQFPFIPRASDRLSATPVIAVVL